MSQSDKNSSFPVDGQLLMVLPRAAASAANPDVKLPILRSDGDGYYLEMRVEADTNGSGEVSVTRRVSLEDLTTEEWDELRQQYDNLNFEMLVAQGVGKGLEKIQDRKIQRLFAALMTFLNPRQVAIVLYLYKLAAEQGNGPVVTFRSNELLDSLGYSKTKGGSFHAKVRSQLNRDLVALHRIELVMAKSLREGDKIGAEVIIKSILRIKSYKIENLSRDFDLVKAADYTYELADSYTISLEFFEGTGRAGDYVLFASDIDITQKQGNNAKNDYKTKLLVYLASRLKWDSPEDGQYLSVSKKYLFKNLDLLGSNSSRNNQIFWRTVEELQQEGYILGAKEIAATRKTASVQFQINPEKLSLGPG